MSNLASLRLEIEELYKKYRVNFTEESESEDFKEFVKYCKDLEGKE